MGQFFCKTEQAEDIVRRGIVQFSVPFLITALFVPALVFQGAHVSFRGRGHCIWLFLLPGFLFPLCGGAILNIESFLLCVVQVLVTRLWSC